MRRKRRRRSWDGVVRRNAGAPAITRRLPSLAGTRLNPGTPQHGSTLSPREGLCGFGEAHGGLPLRP
jgi:hypothetical protein